MLFRDRIITALAELLQLMERERDAGAPPLPPAPEPDEPEPPRLRQSQQPGIDMRAMGLSARDQARQQSFRRMFRR